MEYLNGVTPKKLQDFHLEQTLENVICFWRNGELLAIEHQNGTIRRWSTEPMTRGKSLELFGVDRIQKKV